MKSTTSSTNNANGTSMTTSMISSSSVPFYPSSLQNSTLPSNNTTSTTTSGRGTYSHQQPSILPTATSPLSQHYITSQQQFGSSTAGRSSSPTQQRYFIPPHQPHQSASSVTTPPQQQRFPSFYPSSPTSNQKQQTSTVYSSSNFQPQQQHQQQLRSPVKTTSTTPFFSPQLQQSPLSKLPAKQKLFQPALLNQSTIPSSKQFTSVYDSAGQYSSGTPYRNPQAFSANESLRQSLINRSVLINRVISHIEQIEIGKELPVTVQQYHSLYPLDNFAKLKQNNTVSKVFNNSTETYKSINSVNASPCMLKRVKFGSDEKQPVSWEFAQRYLDIWKQLRHPNLVSLQNIVQSHDFKDGQTKLSTNRDADRIFVYDYFAGETLETHYFINAIRSPPEHLMWSYICQIVAGLKCIHASNLAYRTLHPSKILLMSGNRRIKLNCIGMMDILSPVQERDASTDQPIVEDQVDDIYFDRLAELQDEDITELGYLLLSLAAKTSNSKSDPDKHFAEISSIYSEDFIEFVKFLILETDQLKTVDDLVQMLATRFYDEMVHLYEQNDILEDDFTKELDNGRLLRLLVKLNFAIQHSEDEMRYGNGEVGSDPYVLQLFGDYLFRQSSSEGTPVVDFGHIIETLNKLDAGTCEKILLMSRDEQSLIVASFKELKKSVNTVFNSFFEYYDSK